MGKLNPSQIAEVLAENAPFVAEYLYPDGKQTGHEWRVGSLAGEEGQSLGIRLTGTKAGVWCDFASGEGGDLLDLWMAAKKCGLTAAMQGACKLLKIQVDDATFANSRASYDDPAMIPCRTPKAETPVTKYLLDRGLSMDTLAMFKIGDGGDCIVFPFIHDDKPMMIKRLKLERVNGKKDIRPTSPNQMPCLFGWQAVDPKTRSVCITEGEIDAMSVKEMGMDALSIPFGGGEGAKHAWIENEYDRLQRFDTIFLCLDADQEGKKAANDIAERLGRHRCKVIDLGHKDANEALKAGMDVFDFRIKVEAAKSLDPEELRSSADYCDEVIKEFYPPEGWITGFEMPWPGINFRFRPGEVTILAGTNGHGKSQGVGQITLAAMANGERACLASLEFRPRKLLKRLVRQGTCQAEPPIIEIRQAHEWMGDKLWIYDYCGVAFADKILSVFDYARRKYGITLFVIDNLSKLNISMDDYNKQAEFINKLMAFAKDADVHVILVAHMRKSSDENKTGGKMDVKGSGSITDLPDNCLVWWRNKGKEAAKKEGKRDKDSEPDGACYCTKQREGEDEPRIRLWFHPASQQYTASPTMTPRRYMPR